MDQERRTVYRIYQNTKPGAAFAEGKTWLEFAERVLGEVHGLKPHQKRWFRDLARTDWQAMQQNKDAGAVPATLKTLEIVKINDAWVTRRNYVNTKMALEKPLNPRWTPARAIEWLEANGFNVRTVRTRDGEIVAVRAWNGPIEPVHPRGMILKRRADVRRYLSGGMPPAWLPAGVDTQGIDLALDL
jgi:hypothetical protein